MIIPNAYGLIPDKPDEEYEPLETLYCDSCGENITDDYYYDIDGHIFCKECVIQGLMLR